MKILVILFFIVEYIWDTFLSLINMRFIDKSFEKIPEILRQRISKEEYLKARDYTAAKEKFSIISSALGLIFISLSIYFSVFKYVDSWVKSWPFSRILFFLIIILILQVLSLPVKYYLTFVIEEKFGFNKTTKKTFVLDTLKGIVVSFVILIPLLYLMFLFFDKTGSYWWVFAFIIFVVFQFSMMIIYPLFIAPFFNKFRKLEEGEVLQKINNLACEIDFPLKGVMVMDGSRRSSHSNAYFTGIGKSKRIVFFDTLLEKVTPDEIKAILAHELGHYKLNHVKLGILFSSLFSFIAFFVLSRLLASESFFQMMGYNKPQIHIGMVLFVLLMPIADMFLTPLFNIISRRHEYQADSFARDKTSGKDLIEALIKLNKDNLSSPLVHPLYSFINYSHPPLPERIAAIMNS